MNFFRTSGQNFQFKPIPIHGTDYNDPGNQINVEPMFGHAYG